MGLGSKRGSYTRDREARRARIKARGDWAQVEQAREALRGQQIVPQGRRVRPGPSRGGAA